MTATTKNIKGQIFEMVAHYFTALVILMKGIDKIDVPGKTAYGLVFIVIAALIVTGTVFHHKFERLLKHFKAYVFIFEAIVMSIVGYLYMKEGKQFIQYVCFAAAVMFVVAVIVYIKKAKTKIH